MLFLICCNVARYQKHDIMIIYLHLLSAYTCILRLSQTGSGRLLNHVHPQIHQLPQRPECLFPSTSSAVKTDHN